MGHAQIAYNRGAIYDNGTAEMYGKLNMPDFRGIEGNEDNGVEVLFFWDSRQNLIATAINVACPSPNAERSPGLNADFWHETREALKAQDGKDLYVLG